ncbi:hypothetical protein K9N68_08280 [Kovacikia minuta CCNUW1]|uniref:GlsB/YeaQ/YmgE family stress response membrane protein n=1 Tax=Kovacikia minuta TaxID=2931930 RepID=UPI001CCCE98F|nr:hypothetical protein [Kovacikia minuta]UBF27882.1 hypothetical protein K9N68_08280 [Kovacikia minuta CCNUW1]
MQHLAIHLVVAVIAASIANILIPRRIPGRFLGLILTGLVGVWAGEIVFKVLKGYGVNNAVFHWGILGIPLIPSIVGSVIVLFVVTTLFHPRRYM